MPVLRIGYLRVTHPCATIPENKKGEPLSLNGTVRLACVRHAASVSSEPGSNSPKLYIKELFR